MKTDKNFNMDKSTKQLFSTIYDKEARRLFKKAMISAQVSYEAAKKKVLSSKKNSDNS